MKKDKNCSEFKRYKNKADQCMLWVAGWVGAMRSWISVVGSRVAVVGTRFGVVVKSWLVYSGLGLVQ